MGGSILAEDIGGNAKGFFTKVLLTKPRKAMN
jgi:hypothetical protein